jgi:hypothetical protein
MFRDAPAVGFEMCARALQESDEALTFLFAELGLEAPDSFAQGAELGVDVPIRSAQVDERGRHTPNIVKVAGDFSSGPKDNRLVSVLAEGAFVSQFYVDQLLCGRVHIADNAV